MKLKWIAALLLVNILPINSPIAQTTAKAKIFNHFEKLQYFDLKEVRLLNSPFKEAEQVDRKYLLAIEPDRLLAPYLREAGLKPKAESYTNWENTGLDGHIGGHYISALAMLYASTGDKIILDRLEFMIGVLKQCQQKNGNGYLGGVPGGAAMWQQVAAGKLDVGGFSLNKKWVPWYNIHKMFSGLRDAWLFAGNTTAKQMLIDYSDWCIKLLSNLSDEQVQNMLRAEYGGMNEILADVAAITNNAVYLKAAERFSHQQILKPLLQQKDALNGMHANTQIPKVIGFKRIAELNGDSSWQNASRFFWETVVHNRTVAIGGNSVREHFHPATDFSSMMSDVQGPETCNSYNMLKLTRMLYQSNKQVEYVDYYERTLYNHILSSQHPNGGFVYFTPMRPGHYRVYSQPATSMWCCVGSGMENHTKYGEFIYAHNQQDLFVNLFIPSVVQWKETGLKITQQNNFPKQDRTSLVINTKGKRVFNIHIRYPMWVAANALKIWVNGKPEKVTGKPGTYVAVRRSWKNGDRIEVQLPMTNRLEALPDNSGWVALMHGPIVLAAKTDTTNMKGLFADDSRGGHIAGGKLQPLSEQPILVGNSNEWLKSLQPLAGKPLHFTTNNIEYSKGGNKATFMPFYQLHNARYALYLQQVSVDKWQAMQSEWKQKEEKQMAFEASIVDQVSPGEQQPESDHGFKGEQTNSGLNGDYHWRDASGWFSYEIKNKAQAGRVVQITYWGADANRHFEIWINDKKLANVGLDGKQGAVLFTRDYPLPAGIEGEIFTLKFTALPGSVAGGIYGVKLLR